MSVLDRVAGLVAVRRELQPRVLVGVDGPDAAGKTTFADALAGRLGGTVVRASVDDFHRPRALRLQRGELSPEGCYRDTFDYPALVGGLLAPFHSGADRVLTGVFDYRADEPLEVSEAGVPAAAVLVVDGVFLLRPELRDWWTVSVHLQVPEEVSIRRGEVRDLDVFGSTEGVRQRYLAKYLPAQVLYRAEADPERTADVVLDNTDPEEPVVLRWPLEGADLDHS